MSKSSTQSKTNTNAKKTQRKLPVAPIGMRQLTGENLAIRKSMQRSNSQNASELTKQIALSLALPGQERTFRWSSEFSQKKSATANPFEIVNANFGQGGATNPMLTASETAGFLFRSAECSSILYDENSAHALKTYVAQIRSADGTTFATGVPMYIGPNQVLPILPTQFNPTTASTYAPHGPILFPGAIKGVQNRLVWCDKGDQLRIQVVADAAANLGVIVGRYDAQGWTPAVYTAVFALVAFAPQVLVLKAIGDPAGYYGTSIRNPDPINAIPTLRCDDYTVAGSGACFAHRTVPHYSQNLGRTQGTRVLAASLMYTNTAAILNLGGTSCMYQSGQNEDWLDYISPSNSISLIEKNEDSKTINVKNGMYGFHKPQQPSDFEFKSYVELNGTGNLVDSFYPLDERGSFVVFVASIPAAAGCAGLYTTRYAVEYQSLDTWAQLSYSDIPNTVYSQALNILKHIEPFHENDFHIKDIWEGIKNFAGKIFGAITTYGPTVMKGAEMLAGLL
jgi:hypothetical protein